MHLLPVLLAILPALLGAHYVSPTNHRDPLGSLLVSDAASNKFPTHNSITDFVRSYVRILQTLINTKTPEAYQAHNVYLDNEMLFSECYAPQYHNYPQYIKWLQQFVMHHNNAQIQVLDVRGDNYICDMRLRINVMTMLGWRQEFDMIISASNENDAGWAVLFVNRNLGCT